MLQNRVTVSPSMQLSLGSAGAGAERLRSVLRLLYGVTPHQLLVALIAIGGQLAIAYVALSPSATQQPDGGSTMRLLLPYSAVMLGYLSSYWGLWKAVDFELDAPFSPRRAALDERKRLIASLAPTIMGGAAMLLPMFFSPVVGLLTLLGGYVLMFGMEVVGGPRGMPVAGYQGLRWTIILSAMAILLNVATVHIWNFSLFF